MNEPYRLEDPEYWLDGKEPNYVAKPQPKRLDRWVIGAFTVLAFAVAAGVAFLIMVTPAAAQEGWPWNEFSNENKVHKARRHRHTHRHRKPRVKGYIRRRKARPRDSGGFICAREFSVTGRVKATKERAQKSAWAEFHGAVKFALGERYADDRFARKPRFECARSTSETLTSKTIEAVGGGGVFRHRCHLRAIACKPPVSE